MSLLTPRIRFSSIRHVLTPLETIPKVDMEDDEVDDEVVDVVMDMRVDKVADGVTETRTV